MRLKINIHVYTDLGPWLHNAHTQTLLKGIHKLKSNF